MSKLIYILGGAGTGKTTIAKALARKRGIAFLDMDTLSRPAAEAIMVASGLDPTDRDSPAYKRLCRDLGYRLTMDAALENVELGTDVLVIGPFTKETEDPRWLDNELSRAGLSQADVDVKVIFVYLSDENTNYMRIYNRGLALDQWKLDNWATFRTSLGQRAIRWNLNDASILYFDNTEELSEVRLLDLEEFIYGVNG